MEKPQSWPVKSQRKKKKSVVETAVSPPVSSKSSTLWFACFFFVVALTFTLVRFGVRSEKRCLKQSLVVDTSSSQINNPLSLALRIPVLLSSFPLGGESCGKMLWALPLFLFCGVSEWSI